MNISHVLVRKDHLATIALQQLPAAALADGQVRVRIDSFALTSNNITYAAFGDAMNYWRFFPASAALPEDQDASAWGRIPTWGFGSVTESRHTEVPVGERLYGYFPMSSFVDLSPGKVHATSLFDAAAHRAELHPVYNQYTRCAADPFYTADTEALQALLRPLFITSWLIDDFLADNDFFGAASDPQRRGLVLLSSASSKTAYGSAFQLAKRSAVDLVGLTSAANLGFCESLGCYDRVLSYEQLSQVAPDAPCVYVDFAGNAAFRRSLHAHCQQLKFSSSIGGTHVSDLGSGKDLAGPKPTLFFAPAQIKKRSAEWGSQGLSQKLLQSWQEFLTVVTTSDPPWLTVQHHSGATAVAAAYRQILSGKSDPRLGHTLSL